MGDDPVLDLNVTPLPFLLLYAKRMMSEIRLLLM